MIQGQCLAFVNINCFWFSHVALAGCLIVFFSVVCIFVFCFFKGKVVMISGISIRMRT